MRALRDSGLPRSVQFRKERENEWTELDGLVTRALKKGLRSLAEDDLKRLPVLYRVAASSLSVARRTAMDRALVDYLESLVARAYLAVYGSRRPSRAALRSILVSGFPRQVRAMRVEVLLSLTLFAIGVGVACALTLADSSWYYAFMGAEMAGERNPGSPTKALRDVLYGGGSEQPLAVFSSFLFTHNAGIGLVSFALGFMAGVPTALLVFQNGLTLGAFLALYAQRGLLVPLLGWLLPHGVPEIGALILCGAAGFRLARAILFPGELSVRDALQRGGKQASVVMAGCIVLFAVAGVVEGIFRQVVTDDTLRFALAALNATWLFVWLALAGRSAMKVRPETA